MQIIPFNTINVPSLPLSVFSSFYFVLPLISAIIITAKYHSNASENDLLSTASSYEGEKDYPEMARNVFRMRLTAAISR
jgi:hypothetical protein